MHGSNALKVAIIGCGKIADSHAEQLVRIPGCTLVAVCDREPLMAGQLAQRFGVSEHYSDVDEMLERTRPNVVHITTPPRIHFDLGRRCLERGAHIYVEKPFVETADQAIELLGLAERLGLQVTVGNDAQFTHAARHCRSLIRTGFLGGPPIHMESHYCYEMSGSYAEALMGDRHHWVRKLPGRLLHNIISHGLVRIVEHLVDEHPRVMAHAFRSKMLVDLGEDDILDELRVIIAGDSGVTAYYTFSSQMRPSLHQFRAFGLKNGVQLDDDDHSVLRLRGARYKSYAAKFIPHLTLAKQSLRNLSRNLGLFARSEFHAKEGMKCLMEKFQDSIRGSAPPPVSPREMIVTCRIMDEIFRQIYPKGSLPTGSSER